MIRGVQLVVEPGSVRPGHQGPATGNVWLILEHGAFPAERWNDFVVVILEAWVTALWRLRQGSSCEVVHFMEGPYEVHLSTAGTAGQMLRVHPVVRGRGAFPFEETPETEFSTRLLSSGRRVLSACRRQACWSEDAENLRNAVETLRGPRRRLTDRDPLR
jgi:hypothetical protein